MAQSKKDQKGRLYVNLVDGLAPSTLKPLLALHEVFTLSFCDLRAMAPGSITLCG